MNKLRGFGGGFDGVFGHQNWSQFGTDFDDPKGTKITVHACLVPYCSNQLQKIIKFWEISLPICSQNGAQKWSKIALGGPPKCVGTGLSKICQKMTNFWPFWGVKKGSKSGHFWSLLDLKNDQKVVIFWPFWDPENDIVDQTVCCRCRL